ncbi:hypothetical protein BGW38_004819 [Lunasporangiospora selenospora]|uniref:Uncharacterized protein n=1 Tax=Lunasporangiospora selenospora TaxID=979761 RepID=A0A9P6KHG2_9FUNG|nr:hypothetical protein BGW38_004819 [Lunasporangiospora selenospora]
MLAYLRQLSLHDRLYIRALDISAGREFFDCLSTNVSGVHYGDVADQACVENVLLTQSLLGPRIQDLALTDMGWSPSGLRDILDMALLTTRHLHHLQISLFKMESFLLTALLDTLADLVRRDRRQLKTVILDLAQPMSQIQWESLGECTEMQRFHLGLHRTSQPVLTEILDLVLPKWTHLTALYLCQPRSLTAETIRTLYRDLPRPDRLRELHLIFEACQASLYEHEFLEMIEAMPNLQRLEAQMDWTDRMMDRVATTLWDLRELVVTCSNIRFTCFGIRYVVWGAGMEKLNMRTSGKIWGGFLDAVRQRSKKVKVLVYGSMKWGGLVDEWE